jgi:hypothetical protein
LDWLFEDPWLIGGLGAAAEALLAVALWRTRRGAVLAAMGAVPLLTGAALLVERWVVTDREAVEATLRTAADAVRAGDERRVLQFLAPEAPPEIAAGVRTYLGLFEFKSIVIRAPETQIVKGAQTTARVRFTAHVTVHTKGASIDLAREEMPVFLEVRFRKEQDSWLVTGYEQRSPTGGGP